MIQQPRPQRRARRRRVTRALSPSNMTMEIAKIIVRSESESLDDIKVYLQGKVFHVTKIDYLPAILDSGVIRANSDGKLSSTFGIYNGFFKNRNCVSLFDYRPEPTEEINDFRRRCYPFQPARPPSKGIAILFLKSEYWDNLVPWTQSKDEKAHKEQIVPYVEAGYPVSIPLTHIDEIVSVELTEDPDSIAAKYRKIHESKG